MTTIPIVWLAHDLHTGRSTASQRLQSSGEKERLFRSLSLYSWLVLPGTPHWCEASTAGLTGMFFHSIYPFQPCHLSHPVPPGLSLDTILALSCFPNSCSGSNPILICWHSLPPLPVSSVAFFFLLPLLLYP